MSVIDTLVRTLRSGISGYAAMGRGGPSNVQRLEESRYASGLKGKKKDAYEMQQAVAADKAEAASKRLARALTGLATAGVAANKGFGLARSGFGMMSSAAGKVKAITTASMGTIIGAVSGITNAMMRPLDVMRSAVDPIANLVAKFDPQTVELMERAFSDAAAVMGRMLVPVVQGVTIWVEKFGDVLDAISPIMQPAMDALGQMIASGAQGFMEMAKAAEPLINLLSNVLVMAFNENATIMAERVGIMIGALEAISEAIGAFIAAIFGGESKLMSGPGLKPDAKAKGTAARNIGVSSVEGFASAQFAASMKNIFGKSEGKRPEMFLPDIAKSIEEGKQTVKDILAKAQEIYDVGKEIVSSIVGVVGGPAKAAAKVGDAVGGFTPPPISAAGIVGWLAKKAKGS